MFSQTKKEQIFLFGTPLKLFVEREEPVVSMRFYYLTVVLSLSFFIKK
jgi:hypothetical protein